MFPMYGGNGSRSLLHVAAVHTKTSYFESCPNWVAREELVVRWDTSELHHAELHNDMVDKFLCFSLGQCTFLEVAVDVNIEESRYTSN